MSIEVRQVSKRFGDFVALKDVSFTVPPGELVALLGPSGGGKTTMLRIIAGLETADEGVVLLEGEDATERSARDRGVGFVFQHYALFRHMSVFENVAFGLRVRSRARRPSQQEIDRRVHDLLNLVQLDFLADRLPSQLSGGQRQRVALARALAVEPKVLLLDEPFGALDARVRTELRQWLRRLHDEVHVTTIFVTHDQEEAMDVAEQIVVLNEGAVEQAGKPTDLYDHPETEFVMSFVGTTNRIGSKLVRPHDVQIGHVRSEGSVEAMIDRIVHLGFENRIEMTLGDGSPLLAQLTRAQVEELELAESQIVYVHPSRARVFDSNGTDPRTEELALA